MSTPITLYDVVFVPGGKRYSYLAGGEEYEVGECVVVPAGKDGREAVVQIAAVRSCEPGELRVPEGQLKTIIRRASEAEREAFGKAEASRKPKAKAAPAKQSDDTYISEGLQPDGSLVISYEDYGVESFGGMDYEVIYKLEPDAVKKLKAYLSAGHTGSIECMIREECGPGYRKKALTELFEEAGVEYKYFTWIS